MVIESVQVSANWTGPSEYRMMVPQVQPLDNSLLQYSTEVQVNSNETGNYTCEVQATATNSSHLVPSIPTKNTTEVVISM